MKCYASDYCQKDKSSCSDVCGGYRVLRALVKIQRRAQRIKRINQMEKRIKEERKIMVSKGGVPKGRIISVYLTDEGDVYPIYLHEMGELELIQRLVAGILDNKIVVDTNTRINSENDKISIFDLSKKK